MSATIQFGAFKATIDGWAWTSDNPKLAAMLNANLDSDGPSGSDPNPELHEAQRIAKQFGGQVIRYDETDYVKDRVY